MDADLVKLVEKSNSIFKSLKKRKLVTEKNLNISLINVTKRPPTSRNVPTL